MKREELDAIRKRAEKAKNGNPLRDLSALTNSNRIISEDVPALLAEVERLEEIIAAIANIDTAFITADGEDRYTDEDAMALVFETVEPEWNRIAEKRRHRND